MEGSFADAANHHGFKRARWRRLWRQRIQDYLIATVQNIRIMLRHGTTPRATTAVQGLPLTPVTCRDLIGTALDCLPFTTSQNHLYLAPLLN